MPRALQPGRKPRPGLPCTLSYPRPRWGLLWSKGLPPWAFMKRPFPSATGLPSISLDLSLYSGQKTPSALCGRARKGDSKQKLLRQAREAPKLDPQLLPALGLVDAGSHPELPGPGPGLPAAQSTRLSITSHPPVPDPPSSAGFTFWGAIWSCWVWLHFLPPRKWSQRETGICLFRVRGPGKVNLFQGGC